MSPKVVTCFNCYMPRLVWIQCCSVPWLLDEYTHFQNLLCTVRRKKNMIVIFCYMQFFPCSIRRIKIKQGENLFKTNSLFLWEWGLPCVTNIDKRWKFLENYVNHLNIKMIPIKLACVVRRLVVTVVSFSNFQSPNA